jgi:hypothetical protein
LINFFHLCCTAAWTDIALQAQAMDEFYQQYPILLTPTTAATAVYMWTPSAIGHKSIVFVLLVTIDQFFPSVLHVLV